MAMLAGVFLAATDTPRLLHALDKVTHPFARPPEVTVERVQVVTANPERQFQVVATLSPRGFEPLLASSLRQVNLQMAAHAGGMRMAVVDGALADSAAIASALKGKLPPDRIVVLRADSKREAIGKLLLDRL
jgi:hypothetical protein